MSALSTAEFERLSLIAAGVDPSQIPSILDTATWRRLLIAGLLKNAANQAISGQVDNYSQLPVTVGAPAVGATYLVKYSTGIYYINYKSAGIYVKVADTGSLTDWTYAPLSAVGTLPDVTLTNQQVGDTLVWNGSNWVNSAQSGGGSVNIQWWGINSDFAPGTFGIWNVKNFNISATKSYFMQGVGAARLASGSQASFFFGGVNHVVDSGQFLNYIGSSLFPSNLIAGPVTNGLFNFQTFSFNAILRATANGTIAVGISGNIILQAGTQIVFTQMN